MKRQERRGRTTQSRHNKDRCDVCRGSLVGGLVRTISGGPESGLRGHVECIDGVVAHLVEEHGCGYLGDIRFDD
jgi:hypothetical protein